jgi:thioredoxin-related protein
MKFRRRMISGLIVGLGLLLAGHVNADETGRAGWHNDISSAWKQAKELERPILIYVASNACAYCRKMEEGTLQDPDVQSQVKNGFVGLSINGSSQPKVARSLRVRAYPTTLVYGHDGKLITSKRGYVGPREFQQLLQSIQGE